MASSQVEDTLSLSLEQYLSELTLEPITRGPSAPRMPSRNARSAIMPLEILPGGYRRLKIIEEIDDLAEEAAGYFSKLGPFKSLGGLKLDIPKKAADPRAAFSPYVVNNHLDLGNTLNRFLLRNVQKMLGTMDAEMQDWSFQPYYHPIWEPLKAQTRPIDPILLCRSDETGKPTDVKLVLLPLCPWEFTPKDFQDLITTERFDDTPTDPIAVWEGEEWVNADVIKAYMYDLCVEFDCPYFAVTSHEQWSYGLFSKYYTTAFVTTPMSFNKKAPTVISTLMYWIYVSFEKPNTPSIPEIQAEEHTCSETWERERKQLSNRYIKNLPSREFEEKKRKQWEESLDDISFETKRPRVRNIEVSELKRRPMEHPRRRLYKKLRRAVLAAKMQTNKPQKANVTGDPPAESVFSFDFSVAQSSADPLPPKMIPHRKTDAIQRWRDLVTFIQTHGEAPKDPAASTERKYVDMPQFDPITGEPTGYLEQVEYHECSSCGLPSPTLSDCSLSTEELAFWDQATEEDEYKFSGLKLYQLNL